MRAESTKAQTALITGSSGGIGEELAKIFAARGNNLVLVARTESKLQELAASLSKAHGVHAIALRADLADSAAPVRIAQELRDRRQQIDILVNNAGFGEKGEFAVMDPAVIGEMIQINVVALTTLTRSILPAMLERHSGRILNVASTAAYFPGPLMAVYYASKAYVLSLSEALANEVEGTGVTVTALCPGPTQTGFAQRAKVEKARLFRSGAMSAEAVARAGYDGLMRGATVVIPGFKNRWTVRSSGLAPRRLLAKVTRALNESPGA